MLNQRQNDFENFILIYYNTVTDRMVWVGVGNVKFLSFRQNVYIDWYSITLGFTVTYVVLNDNNRLHNINGVGFWMDR